MELELKRINELMMHEINTLYDYRCGNQEAIILRTIKERIDEGNRLILSGNEVNPREKRKFFLYCYVANMVISITERIISLKNCMREMIEKGELHAYGIACDNIDRDLQNLSKLVEDAVNIDAFIFNAHGAIKYYRFIVLEQNKYHDKTRK